jgi:hypothetical protein
LWQSRSITDAKRDAAPERALQFDWAAVARAMREVYAEILTSDRFACRPSTFIGNPSALGPS